MAGRVAAGLTLLLVLLGVGTGAAEAGGGRLTPVQDRYEPGGVATMVGYTGGPALAGIPEEPFYAYLRAAGEDPGTGLGESDLYVGELVLEETGHGGYLGLRVSITFEVPADLEPGDYELTYCDDPCTATLIGDLVPSPLSIGVDPARRVVREWALDDPQVANLAPGALLVGPGFQATAAQVLAGQAVPTTAGPPSTLPASTIPPATTAAVPAVGPAPPSVPVTPAPSDDMEWPLPTALVVGSAMATGLVLARRQRAVEREGPSATLRSPATGDRRAPGAASAGRG